MLDDAADVLPLPQRRNVRLDTLLRLRWLAIIGQTIAVLVVYYAIEFPLPIWACISVIALSAWLNIALQDDPDANDLPESWCDKSSRPNWRR